MRGLYNRLHNSQVMHAWLLAVLVLYMVLCAVQVVCDLAILSSSALSSSGSSSMLLLVKLSYPYIKYIIFTTLYTTLYIDYTCVYTSLYCRTYNDTCTL